MNARKIVDWNMKLPVDYKTSNRRLFFSFLEKKLFLPSIPVCTEVVLSLYGDIIWVHVYCGP